MKQLFLFIFMPLLIGGLIGTGCDNTIHVSGEKKNELIVYGLLNPKDTAHYIKITRSFLDPDENAEIAAANPDSIHPDSLQVKLEEWWGTRFQRTIHLKRVDGNQEGLNMEEGVFASSPNVLYKTKTPLNQDYQYELIAFNRKDDQLVKAKTPIVNDFNVTYPAKGTTIDFARDQPETINIRWKSAKDGMIYQLIIHFHFTEQSTKTGQVTQKTLDWVQFNRKESRGTKGGADMVHSIVREKFFRFVGNRIEPNESVVREAKMISMTFAVGAKDLYTYMRSQRAQQFSLSHTKATEEYTNIENGRGIFSSRNSVVIDSINLASPTLDSLACGRYTKTLNFKGVCK